MVQRQRQRHGTAKRVADNKRPFQPLGRDEVAHEPRLLCQAARKFCWPCRIAGPRPVDCNKVKVAAEPAEQGVAKVVKLAAEAVEEQDRTALPLFDIMNAVAAESEELSRGRHGAFGLAGDATRRQNEIAGGECRNQHRNRSEPEDNRAKHDEHPATKRYQA